MGRQKSANGNHTVRRWCAADIHVPAARLFQQIKRQITITWAKEQRWRCLSSHTTRLKLRLASSLAAGVLLPLYGSVILPFAMVAWGREAPGNAVIEAACVAANMLPPIAVTTLGTYLILIARSSNDARGNSKVLKFQRPELHPSGETGESGCCPFVGTYYGAEVM